MKIGLESSEIGRRNWAVRFQSRLPVPLCLNFFYQVVGGFVTD